jgi:16S rRNA (adenine1518-N6/adenine1519-N6)-dimethyltransferase
MDLTSCVFIKELFKKKGIKVSKGLGQNFLVDRNVLEKIIKAAEISPDDVVLEIGPGIGNLTQELAKSAKKVIAVEKDPKMVEILKEILKCSNVTNVEIVQGDILKLGIFNFQFSIFKRNPNSPAKKATPEGAFQIPKQYKIVANLPYYITSPVIRKFLESENPPSEMILMVQKEVAQRICARPPRMNLLAVSVQFYAEPKIVSYVSKNSFWPSPKVDSAILRIAPLINADRKQINVDLFFRVVKAGFSQPRKQILNNLSKKLKLTKKEVSSWLSKNNISPTQRVEKLSIGDWIRLVENYSHLPIC